MGRPPKIRETQPELQPVCDEPELDEATIEELAALRADLRVLAAYIADRDQLKLNTYGSRIAEIALEQ